MRVFKAIKHLHTFLVAEKQNLRTVGLVPTMGALHKGHLQRIKASKAENDVTVCSTYKNPAQCNNLAELEKYPRSFDTDVALLRHAGFGVIFAPTNGEMHALLRETKFNFGALDKTLKGKFHSVHFSGLALAVSNFFNIVKPHRAFCGQKDYQQLKFVNRLMQERMFHIDVKSLPKVADQGGLAQSSSNQRLTEKERRYVQGVRECQCEVNKNAVFRQTTVASQSNVGILLHFSGQC